MLYEVYQVFRQHPNVIKYAPLADDVYYGPEPTRGPTTAPHIEFIPTEDKYLPPLWVDRKQIVDGKWVAVEASFSRGCGVKLCLYHKQYLDLEIMINDIVNALYDTFQSTGNFEVQSGRMINREDITNVSVGYELEFFIKVPIWRPKQLATVTSTTLTVSITPPA